MEKDELTTEWLEAKLGRSLTEKSLHLEKLVWKNCSQVKLWGKKQSEYAIVR